MDTLPCPYLAVVHDSTWSDGLWHYRNAQLHKVFQEHLSRIHFMIVGDQLDDGILQQTGNFCTFPEENSCAITNKKKLKSIGIVFFFIRKTNLLGDLVYRVFIWATIITILKMVSKKNACLNTLDSSFLAWHLDQSFILYRTQRSIGCSHFIRKIICNKVAGTFSPGLTYIKYGLFSQKKLSEHDLRSLLELLTYSEYFIKDTVHSSGKIMTNVSRYCILPALPTVEG